VEATYERDCALLEDKAHAVIAYSDAVVFPFRVQASEMGDLLKGLGGLNLLDRPLDPPEQTRISDGSEVFVK
jgi:hypothetical protein